VRRVRREWVGIGSLVVWLVRERLPMREDREHESCLDRWDVRV